MYEHYDYVIYHKNCYDGFTGLFVLSLTKYMDDRTIIYPDVPSATTIPSNIDNKNIIIIDVAYSKQILSNIVKRVKKMTFIDHHLSIRSDVEELDIPSIHEIVYDVNKSGASLTWEYFFPQKTLPKFIKYVQDNDIGTWKLKHTIPFITALELQYNTYPSKYNLEHWKSLLDDSIVANMIKDGILYNQYKDYLVHNNSKKISMHYFPSNKIHNMYPNIANTIGQYKVAVYNGVTCPNTASLSINILDNNDCDFVIFWVLNLNQNKYILQLRSKTVDVSEIAKTFGGGGHALASACAIDANKFTIQDLFMSFRVYK